MWQLLLALALSAAAATPMHGISQLGSLISIDTVTGNLTQLTPPMKDEAWSQQLAAVDVKRGWFYTAGFNRTSAACNLLVWDLKKGVLSRTVALPFRTSALVGVGQSMDVDPKTGTLVMMGHDPSSGHHIVYTADPSSFAFTKIADLGGGMHVDSMDASTALDSDLKQVYVLVTVNDTVTKRANTSWYAVPLGGGRAERLPLADYMTDMAYDSKTKRMYGTSWNAGVRTLAYFDTANRAQGKLVTVSKLELAVQNGNLRTFDSAARVLYSVLQGAAKRVPYVPTDFCKAHWPCASGSSCCSNPADKSAGKGYGTCFAVDDCSKLSSCDPKQPACNPLTNVVYLVGVNIDTGKTVSKAPLCALDSPNLPRCPWSIGAA